MFKLHRLTHTALWRHKLMFVIVSPRRDDRAICEYSASTHSRCTSSGGIVLSNSIPCDSEGLPTGRHRGRRSAPTVCAKTINVEPILDATSDPSRNFASTPTRYLITLQ